MTSSEDFNQLTAVPCVSYDIKLGKTTSYIDFDYLAYDNSVRDESLSDEQISRLSFHHYPLRRIHALTGVTNPRTGEVYIGVNSYTSPEELNCTFFHESSHAIDTITKAETSAEKLHGTVTHLFRAATYATAITGLGEEARALFDTSEKAAITGGVLFVLSAASFIGRMVSYATEPQEIRANQLAQASRYNQVIRYIGKDKSGLPFVAKNPEEDPSARIRKLRLGRLTFTLTTKSKG
jgi:hypothetical protein